MSTQDESITDLLDPVSLTEGRKLADAIFQRLPRGTWFIRLSEEQLMKIIAVAFDKGARYGKGDI